MSEEIRWRRPKPVSRPVPASGPGADAAWIAEDKLRSDVAPGPGLRSRDPAHAGTRRT